MTELAVTTLGTGSPIPDPNRAGPSTLVRAAGHTLLVDCGRGSLMRAAAVGAMPPMLSALLLTHMHSDHITDLNDVITSRWAMSLTENPLRIVGPPGTRELVERTLTMLTFDIGYRLEHHDDLQWQPPVEVTEVLDGEVDLGLEGVRIVAAPTDHSPVKPTVGYRIEVPDADGGTKVVALAGDTVPCEGLDRLCHGADVYVQTVIDRPTIESLPIARLQDVVDYHSSVADAGRTATRAGVGTLVLTHMVPAPPPTDEGEAPWRAAAAEHFAGTVLVARDLSQVVI